jgi:hypothetical protein
MGNQHSLTLKSPPPLPNCPPPDDDDDQPTHA